VGISDPNDLTISSIHKNDDPSIGSHLVNNVLPNDDPIIAPYNPAPTPVAVLPS